jgi:DNA-binding CsgD family transcriptional regulator
MSGPDESNGTPQIARDVVAAAERIEAASANEALAATVEIPRPNTRGQLSPREGEVVALLAEGLTNAEIAKVLGCSPNTVEAHKYRLFAKLGARNAAHAVAICLRRRPA